MSVEVITEVKKDKAGVLTIETKFPFLMRAKNNGMVVLFSGEKKGTVIDVGSPSHYGVLSSSTTFMSCYDSDTWETIEAGTEYSIKLTFKGYDR